MVFVICGGEMGHGDMKANSDKARERMDGGVAEAW